jgi:hypothetical protein
MLTTDVAPELEAFARLLGANETFPGTLESYMRETVNGSSTHKISGQL